jgi:hypothetical protein
MGKNRRTRRLRKGGFFGPFRKNTTATPVASSQTAKKSSWFSSPAYVTKEELETQKEGLKKELNDYLETQLNLIFDRKTQELELNRETAMRDIESSRSQIKETILRELKKPTI